MALYTLNGTIISFSSPPPPPPDGGNVSFVRVQ